MSSDSFKFNHICYEQCPEYTLDGFDTTLGNICNGSMCSYAIGAGIRPEITIARNDIIYNIETQTDNNVRYLFTGF